MDQDLTESERRRYKIEPPSEATFTTFLNNIGNWGMLAAAPAVMMSFYDEMMGKATEATRKSRGKTGVVMTATGCVLGAVFGLREAQRLQSYRHAVSDEVADLRAEVNANTKTIAQWVEKEGKRQQAAPGVETPTR